MGRAAITAFEASGRWMPGILLDLQMPGVDGFDVLTYMQEHRSGRLPVILLSGDAAG